MATLSYPVLTVGSTPAETLAPISTYSPSRSSRQLVFAGQPIKIPATTVASPFYYWS